MNKAQAWPKRTEAMLPHLRQNGGVIIGELPSRPIEKAMAGEGLLAQIIIDKYVDHLPLHRQMQRFERSGVKLSYATLTDWVSDTCRLITPNRRKHVNNQGAGASVSGDNKKQLKY